MGAVGMADSGYFQYLVNAFMDEREESMIDRATRKLAGPRRIQMHIGESFYGTTDGVRWRVTAESKRQLNMSFVERVDSKMMREVASMFEIVD